MAQPETVQVMSGCRAFANRAALVENAAAQSDTEIVIFLSSLGQETLVAAEGFGGRVATGGIEDKLNAESGFLKNALGGGGVASLRIDPQGKAFAQQLLEIPVAVPKRLAEELQSDFKI